MPTKIDDGQLMKRTFTARVSELRAMLLFASDDEKRPVLNGVRVEVKRRGAPLLISTNGRVLACLEICAEQPNKPDVAFEFTLATHFLKPLCEFAKRIALEIAFEYHPQDRLICHFVGTETVLDCEKGSLADGTYPDWRSVVPKGERQLVPSVGFNAQYIGDFAKAAKLLDITTPIIGMNMIGASGAIDIRIENRPQFYAILMPAKINEDQAWQPEFLGFGASEAVPTPEPEAETKAA